MDSIQTPFYISKRSLKNFWQEYRIFPDRIELQSWILFHTLIIPISHIMEIESQPAFPIGDLFSRKGIASSFSLKIDCSDFCSHTMVKKKSGLIKYIRFTPDDPDKFVDIVKSLIVRK